MSGNSVGEQVTQLSRLKYSPQRKKPNSPPPDAPPTILQEAGYEGER